MSRNPSRSGSSRSYQAALDQQFNAIGQLFDRHRRELLDFARRRLRLQHVPDVEYSEDDVVQSSIRTFFEDLLEGKIGRTEDEDGTLRILRRIIADKVSARRAKMRASKRDPSRIRRWMGGIVIVLSTWDGAADDHTPGAGDEVDLYQLGVPSAEVKLIAEENLARLMDALDPELQMIAKLRLRFTIPEGARRLGISESSFKRRLATIRETWKAFGLVDKRRSQ